jgi:glycosyltransferase involved in cell wall biosynthesis
MQHSPPISVVIIGRNEGPRLSRCLESVLASDYPKDQLELIYVDSDSTDDSCIRAEQRGARIIRIHPERPCAAIGRNAGFRAARHDLVQFLDGDTILNRDWLRRAAGAIENQSVACVFGRREEMAAHATIFNFWAHHDWYVPPGPADSCAGDVLFRRSVLEKAGGYDESLIAGEEPDLCYRIRTQQGLTILSLDEPMTLHDMGMTRWRQYWRRCMRTGHAYAEVGGRNAGMTRWRAARWRNLFYALGTPAAIMMSLVLWLPWPVVAWLAVVLAALGRNAYRMHDRVGSWSDALSYSLHHYLAKTPAAVGQCVYWFRAALNRGPQRLIEYRTPNRA